jgi:hypothetical protein
MDNPEQQKELSLLGRHLSRNLFLGVVSTAVVLFSAGGYYLWQMNKVVVSESKDKIAELELAIDEERQKYQELQIESEEKTHQINDRYDFAKLNYIDCASEESDYRGCVLVDTHDFSYKDLAGSVEYICELTSYFDGVCVGNGHIQVTYDGQSKVVEEYTWSDREEMLFTPYNIFFTEGSFTHSTTSNSENVRLLINLDISKCRNVDGVCIPNYVITHEVSFPDLEVNKLSNINSWARPAHFSWNKQGDKAVQWIPCPAGCPSLMYQGVNLNTGAKTPLMWRNDDSTTSEIESPVEGDIYYERGNIEWLDDSTVKIGDYEFSI